MPYEDKIMVASGDSEHPGTEEVSFETIPRHGGSGFDPDNLLLSTNTPADADEIITKESSTWYRKTFSKVWNYTKGKIKSVLGINESTASDIFNIYGAKNLIPKQTSYIAGTDGSGYVSPILNADGTVEFGSFSDGTYVLCEFDVGLSLPKTGDYIFTTGLTDASDNTAYIEVYKTSNGSPIKVYNDPVVIENVNYIHHITLKGLDGQSRLYKPMLRTIGVESNEYAPFAMTNKQLTDLAITKEMIYPVGSIIYSTTCDTMAKVVAAYGGNVWIRHKGYFLRGATDPPMVIPNYAIKDGGNDDLIVPYHNHGFTGSAVTSGASSASNTGGQSQSHKHTVNGGATTTGGMSANNPHRHGMEYVGSSVSGYGLMDTGAGRSSGYKYTANTDIAHTHSQVAHTHTVSDANQGHTHDMKHTHSVTAAGTVGYAGTNGNTTNANIPNYKSVYIWERTA